jgi:hypothetical protein
LDSQATPSRWRRAGGGVSNATAAGPADQANDVAFTIGDQANISALALGANLDRVPVGDLDHPSRLGVVGWARFATAASAASSTTTTTAAAPTLGQRFAGLSVSIPVEVVRVLVRVVALEEVLGLVLGVEVGAILIYCGSCGRSGRTGREDRHSGPRE